MNRFLLLFSAAALALAGCYTNPATGRQSLMLISPDQELQLGAESFAEIRQQEKVSSNTADNERVRRVGERIAAAVGNDLPQAKWEFVVFDSDTVNAFALPGGKVGVYSGLLKLAKTDDELAIVMGHEIGHVTARHGAERMSEAMVISGLGAAGAALMEKKYSAETTNLFMMAYGGGTTLLRVLPQSRQNESEADKMGLIYAAKAGYDPRAAVTFWQKMKAESDKQGSKTPAFLSTHPADAQRIADIEAYLPQVLPVYEKNKRG